MEQKAQKGIYRQMAANYFGFNQPKQRTGVGILIMALLSWGSSLIKWSNK